MRGELGRLLVCLAVFPRRASHLASLILAFLAIVYLSASIGFNVAVVLQMANYFCCWSHKLDMSMILSPPCYSTNLLGHTRLATHSTV